MLSLLLEYRTLIEEMEGTSLRQAGRLKQWIKLIGRTYEESNEFFARIRRIQSPDEINDELHRLIEDLPALDAFGESEVAPLYTSAL